MGKKQSGSAAAKAAKKAKAAAKTEKKEVKKAVKSKSLNATPSTGKSKGKGGKKSRADDSDSDDDLEGILEKMRKEWEEAHTVTEELVEGPPSRRANATLTACPNGNHLWCIGGEFFSDDNKAYFYNDVFRYTPEKDEWRKYVSPTCPGPRSAHAVVASPIAGGKLFLFGGEFSSLHQNSFHHYRDFWCFDIQTHSWDRIETKETPSARSGHRMAIWKHYIVLFGGFYDPGITTRYLNDLWLFDTQEYKWHQAQFRETDNKPSPRSGFSFLPCADGIVLHGGYCKEYSKGKRPVGVMLDDTWLLKITLPSADTATPNTPTAKPPPSSKNAKSSTPAANRPIVKWERRKRPSDAFAPSLRSGCTMTLWAAKSMGILFGGVTDEDTNEETLESVFHNDLFAYQLGAKGKWSSMALRKPKAKGGKKKKEKKKQEQSNRGRGKGRDQDSDEDDAQQDADKDDDDDDEPPTPITPKPPAPKPTVVPLSKLPETPDEDDPNLTTPLPRYNAMLAVLRNTLYIYGGIFEKGSKEYTMDDFYSIPLDKLDRYTCLKASEIVIPDEEVESSEDEDDDEDDEDEDDGSDDEGADEEENGSDEQGDDEGEEDQMGLDDSAESTAPVVQQPVAVEVQPDIKVAESEPAPEESDEKKDDSNSENTPLPGETLALFYARTKEYWARKLMADSAAGREQHRGSGGKEVRRGGFALAEERYIAYRPTQKELEKILAEAGLDEEEMRRSAAAGGGSGTSNALTSRNRR